MKSIHSGLVDACAARTHEVLRSELEEGSKRDEKYEEKQNALLKAILKTPEFAGNFAFEDLRDYLQAIYSSVSKPLKDATVEDLKPGVLKFLSQEATSFDFFFEIGDARGFKDGYEIGRARFVSFSGLPPKVREKIAEGWKYEYERDKSLAKDFDAYAVARGSYWYLETKTESIGTTKAFQKALENAKRAFDVASLLFLHGSYHSSRESEHSFRRWYGFGRGMRIASTYGFNQDEPLIRVEFIDGIIESASKVLKADKPTDLEEAIISSIDVHGLITAQAPLYIRFLLTIIAIESLLMHGESQDTIASKLAERVAVLLGDTPAWMIGAFGIKREELTKEFVDSHLAESRIKLQNRFKIIYSKRSGAAHEGLQSEGRIVTEEDYQDANMFLRFVLQMLLHLKETNNLDRIAIGERHDEKSLAEFVDSRKYSFSRIYSLT